MTGVRRRSFLASVAGLGTVALAGCPEDYGPDSVYQTSCADGCQYVDDVAIGVKDGAGFAPDFLGFRLSLQLTDPITGAASVEIRDQDGELVYAESEALDREPSVTFQAERFGDENVPVEIMYAVEVERA